MGRLLKLLAVLIIILLLGVIGYAYLGDLSADQTEISEPVELNAD